MLKRKFEFLFILLLLVGVASASTPNNQVTQLFDESVINGENDIGNVLIIPLQYTPETYIFVNFSQKQAERYDNFQWQGNGSISVQDPASVVTVIVPNAQYYFSTAGIYTITSLLNSSYHTQIIVTNAPLNAQVITVTDIPNGMELNFSEDVFTITSEEKIVSASLYVESDVLPGEYTINYTVAGQNKSYTFDVDHNFAWNITDIEFNEDQQIKSGEARYLGTVTVENLGNDDVEVEIIKSGNESKMVVVQLPRIVYVGTSVEFDVQLQIPSVVTTGLYPVVLTFQDDYGNKQNITLDIEVVDALKPIIESINFSTDKAFTSNEISVIATDNDDVVNLTLEFDDKKIYLDKDQNLFTTNYMFDKISKYDMVFCAHDKSENVVCEHINRTFIKISALEGVQKSIRLPTVKFSSYSEHFLFNLTEDLDDGIVIQLVNVESDVINDDSYTVRIADAEGGIKRFDTYDNVITIKEAGTYSLEFRSNEERKYEGLLSYDVPEYVDPVFDTSFVVSFKDYQVTPAFSMDWSGKNNTCAPEDTGDYDSSEMVCRVAFPVDIKKEDISLPTTVREREQLDKDVEIIQDQWDTSKRRSAVIISLLVFVMIIMIWLVYYISNVYPYVRTLRRIKYD